MLKVIDLYSGLGGASEAFIRAGHDVVRIENNPDLAFVEETVIADVAWAHTFYGDSIDLVWASPPCQDFSQAFSARRPTARREGREFQPDMKPLISALEIISNLKPKYFVIENVVGAIKDFKPHVGNPTQIIGAFVLWHNLPHLVLPPGYTHTKVSQDPGSRDPLRSNKRAKVPLELSTACLDSILTPTLEDYL
tara:strand:+ start:142 stop:723 length:582 start_codon:yes stop_codon:yes gene_type:complete